MLARALEAQGVATTSISMVREHTEKVKPPRALFVPFPYGHALGRPNDPELQHRVLQAALDLLAAPSGPAARFSRRRRIRRGAAGAHPGLGDRARGPAARGRGR